MAYKYKESVKNAVNEMYSANFVDEENRKNELDQVYAQAEKADEYEAKAKAWDKYKAHMESHIAGEINEEELVSDLKSDYFESGESNAKK